MKKYATLFFFLFVSALCNAQPTVGLQQYDIPNADGYLLFSPMQSHKTFLIDKCGRKINEWTSQYNPGLGCSLLDHGILLRTGSDSLNNTFGVVGGIIEEREWNNNLIWQYKISSTLECQHHDVLQLPNGNILAIVWELKTKPQAVSQGRNPSLTSTVVWSEKVVEIKPTGINTGNVVWEWHLWDHLGQEYDATKPNFLMIREHPELVNINQFAGPNKPDWIHMNSLDYNPLTDQILMSAHAFQEIWIIDHSTTTAEAASHSGGISGNGGDLLYRWGNPQCYNRGTAVNKKFWGQHNAQWIKPGYPNAGKIIVFNNGTNRTPVPYSTIDIIDPPMDASFHYSIDTVNAFMPDTVYWNYTASIPTDFYSPNISGVTAVNNGSFVICEGSTGRFFEINQNKQIIWQYTNPYGLYGPTTQYSQPQQNNVFRAPYYTPSYSGFIGLTLTPGSPIELNPISPSICDSLNVGIDQALNDNVIFIYPNPTSGILNFNIPGGKYVSRLELYNIYGQIIMAEENRQTLDMSALPKGIYLLRYENCHHLYSKKIIKV